MENGLPWPGSSAAEAALREHFSGEEGTKAVEQQVCFHMPLTLAFAGQMMLRLCVPEVLIREKPVHNYEYQSGIHEVQSYVKSRISQRSVLCTGEGQRGYCGHRGPFAAVHISDANHDFAVHRPGQVGKRSDIE